MSNLTRRGGIFVLGGQLKVLGWPATLQRRRRSSPTGPACPRCGGRRPRARTLGRDGALSHGEVGAGRASGRCSSTPRAYSGARLASGSRSRVVLAGAARPGRRGLRARGTRRGIAGSRGRRGAGSASWWPWLRRGWPGAAAIAGGGPRARGRVQRWCNAGATGGRPGARSGCSRRAPGGGRGAGARGVCARRVRCGGRWPGRAVCAPRSCPGAAGGRSLTGYGAAGRRGARRGPRRGPGARARCPAVWSSGSSAGCWLGGLDQAAAAAGRVPGRGVRRLGSVPG